MDKHTRSCIEFFELMARSYDERAAEAKRKYDEAGPGSFWHDDMMRAEAVADAYRTCVEALQDPEYFSTERLLARSAAVRQRHSSAES